MIGADRNAASTAWVAAGFVFAVAVSAAGAIAAGGDQQVVTWAVAATAVGASLAYFIWYADPAYTLTAGLLLSPFADHWPQAFGIPGPLSPDRLLLLAGVGAVILRAPAVRDRPRLRIEAVHWVLGAAVLYATFSAAASGTLFEKAAFFRLFEAFGVLPFAIFLVAPLAFRTHRQRMVLLTGLVALGGYLGLTALFEASGLRALVYPRYILESPYVGRASGPFLAPVLNGIALYACAVSAGIALISWKKRGARLVAASVGGLCLPGTLLTMERSVWLGAMLATVVAVALLPEGRRMFMRIVLALLIAFAVALAVVPGLGSRVSERYGDQGTIWARQNLNRAALNMAAERPMFGFGWDAFDRQRIDYFQQSPNYPLSGANSVPHNLFLGYTAELGLLGLGLWTLGLGLVVAGALAVRGPPDLDLWRTGLIPITIFLITVVNFVPGSPAFATRALCLWAGVVWSGRYSERQHDAGAATSASRIHRPKAPLRSTPAPSGRQAVALASATAARRKSSVHSGETLSTTSLIETPSVGDDRAEASDEPA